MPGSSLSLLRRLGRLGGRASSSRRSRRLWPLADLNVVEVAPPADRIEGRRTRCRRISCMSWGFAVPSEVTSRGRKLGRTIAPVSRRVNDPRSLRPRAGRTYLAGCHVHSAVSEAPRAGLEPTTLRLTAGAQESWVRPVWRNHAPSGEPISPQVTSVGSKSGSTSVPARASYATAAVQLRAKVERNRLAASLGLGGWLAVGLHERSDSLEEEVGDGPWRLPDVDACDPSVTRFRGDQRLGWIGYEAQAFVPPLPLLAWQNTRFDEHSWIVRRLARGVPSLAPRPPRRGPVGRHRTSALDLGVAPSANVGGSRTHEAAAGNP